MEGISSFLEKIGGELPRFVNASIIPIVVKTTSKTDSYEIKYDRIMQNYEIRQNGKVLKVSTDEKFLLKQISQLREMNAQKEKMEAKRNKIREDREQKERKAKEEEMQKQLQPFQPFLMHLDLTLPLDQINHLIVSFSIEAKLSIKELCFLKNEIRKRLGKEKIP